MAKGKQDIGVLSLEFDEVLLAWQNYLKRRGLSNRIRWVFRENMCLAPRSEKDIYIYFETEINPNDGKKQKSIMCELKR